MSACLGCRTRAEQIAEVAGGTWSDYMPTTGHLWHGDTDTLVEVGPSLLSRVALVVCALIIAGSLIAVGYLIGMLS